MELECKCKSQQVLKDDISVIICTCNRCDSLRITLNCLVKALKPCLTISIIVVDNNSTDDTKAVVNSFTQFLNLHYVLEKRKGKPYCLNTALDLFHYHGIIAFLDDDMSVETNWLQGIYDICMRYPGCDVFTGNSYVIWPVNNPPKWASSGLLNSWGFSVQNRGSTDKPIRPDYWPGGGHFWIRSRVLECGIRFDEPLNEDFAPTGYVSDPDFQLQMFSLGFKGMSGPDASVGHRIQQDLLLKETMSKRAITCGKSMPYIRSTYPDLFFRAKLLKISIVAYWLFHLLRLLFEFVMLISRFFIRDLDIRFSLKTVSISSVYNNYESLFHPLRIRSKLKTNQLKLQRLRKSVSSGNLQ